MKKGLEAERKKNTNNRKALEEEHNKITVDMAEQISEMEYRMQELDRYAKVKARRNFELTTDKEVLLGMNRELRSLADAIKSQKTVLQQRVQELENTQSNTQETYTGYCFVCTEHVERGFSCFMCSHFTCTKCTERLPESKCPHCRSVNTVTNECKFQ